MDANFGGFKTRVWYDALTGKHVRYGVAITRHLRSQGHVTVLTTRKHPDTVPLLEYLKEKAITTGRYNPKSLMTRLKEGTRRQLLFCRMLEKSPQNVAISHGSVDQCRVAFGLGIPIISTIDTPYADAVHKLTLPLSKYIVASKAIPKRILQTYNVDGEIVSFNGVDEVAWIKNFKPQTLYDFGRPLIVVRPLEERAAYADDKMNSLTLAKKLTKLGKVVFLSRYKRSKIKDLTVPDGFVDSASLAAQADLLVGVGGTITREAALQGTPAIVVKVFSGQYVNDLLIKKGFPIHETNVAGAFALAKKLLGQKHDVKDKLDSLENPVDVVSSIVKRIGEN